MNKTPFYCNFYVFSSHLCSFSGFECFSFIFSVFLNPEISDGGSQTAAKTNLPRHMTSSFLVILYSKFHYHSCQRGTVTTILLLSRQNFSEIMTQSLCSKPETLLQPQEDDIQILQGRANQCFFFFLEIFPTQNDKT